MESGGSSSGQPGGPGVSNGGGSRFRGRGLVLLNHPVLSIKLRIHWHQLKDLGIVPA